MAKIWKVKNQAEGEAAESLAEYPKLMRQLLFNRGLTEKGNIQDFLEPRYEGLHSPFLFKDMERAVERIWQAVEKKEKICIYGDYDADAVTANAVLQQTFRYLGAEVTWYIPDRFSEGYGLNLEAFDKLRRQGCQLVITVDCGTNSIDAADFCADNYIDLIITDHHEIIGEAPKAYALINPKNPNDNYPYSEITGVGVAFKLACGILNDVKRIDRWFNAVGNGLKPFPTGTTAVTGWEKWLLDLVAIGTVADCHSLLGENRILVKYGLKVLAKTKWVGLRALMESAGLKASSEGYPRRESIWKPMDTYTLGFVIAPRLNAAGRLEHANIALDLLMEPDIVSAQEQAAALEAINSRRQDLTKSILSEAKEKVLLIQERKVLALVGEGWPKGVMGLVAGRLAEEYYKPVIVLERTETICTGSARTAGDFNLIEALKFSADHLTKFGGHKQAAGLSLEIGQFELFYQKLLTYADANINEQSSQKVLELETGLQAGQLTADSYQLIQRLEPFGVNNPKPKFLISAAAITSARLVGKEGQHLQLKLNIAGREINSIMFSAPDFARNLKIGDTIDVAAELIEDNWNGNSLVKLRIIDIKLSNN